MKLQKQTNQYIDISADPDRIIYTYFRTADDPNWPIGYYTMHGFSSSQVYYSKERQPISRRTNTDYPNMYYI
jgi:hypothetical protein